jgi:hypothetical protein
MVSTINTRPPRKIRLGGGWEDYIEMNLRKIDLDVGDIS